MNPSADRPGSAPGHDSVSALPLAGLGAVFATGAGGPTVMSLAGVVGVIYTLAVTVVFTTLGTIFRVAVYSYAVTEQAPPEVDADLIRSAFHTR